MKERHGFADGAAIFHGRHPPIRPAPSHFTTHRTDLIHCAPPLQSVHSAFDSLSAEVGRIQPVEQPRLATPWCREMSICANCVTLCRDWRSRAKRWRMNGAAIRYPSRIPHSEGHCQAEFRVRFRIPVARVASRARVPKGASLTMTSRPSSRAS